MQGPKGDKGDAGATNVTVRVLDLFLPNGSGKLRQRIIDATAGDGTSVESWRVGAPETA